MSESLLDLEGGCHCGAVRYRARGADPVVAECHCSQCRRQSGHRFATTAAKNGDLTVQAGEERITWYRATPQAERGFCSLCGSTLFWRADGDDHTAILAGSVDEPNGLRLAKHIFVADKGAYYEIDDDLPQFPASG